MLSESRGAAWFNVVREQENATLPEGQQRPLIAPPKSVAAQSLEVYANHGRWVVDCPCGSAQLASKDDRRFFCVECRNAWCQGKWAPVVWPANLDDIEGLLDMRLSKNANWKPGEDVMTLVAENVAAGLAV